MTWLSRSYLLELVLPIHEKRHTETTLIGRALATTEGTIIAGKSAARAFRHLAGPIVTDKDDEGIFPNLELVKQIHQLADIVIHVLEHRDIVTVKNTPRPIALSTHSFVLMRALTCPYESDQERRYRKDSKEGLLFYCILPDKISGPFGE